MRISLFSQSLFTLSLDEAIEATARLGYEAIELACCPPHLSLDRAIRDAAGIARRIASTGLAVSALSGFNCFTNRSTLGEQVEAAETFIRLASVFGTDVVKLTPGGPASAEATWDHWDCLQDALERLVSVARQVEVRLAFETHMRQLTDTLASSKRLLTMAPPDVLGLTVDYSNMAFAGEAIGGVVRELLPRTVNTHLKNGYVDADGGWRFRALDDGLTDYDLVLGLLHEAEYRGYLTIECLGPEAQARPLETAGRDLGILRRYLAPRETMHHGGILS